MKKGMLYIVSAAAVLFMTGPAFAGGAWEMEITAQVQDATNRLVIGQAADATEGKDGRYDIPALLGGDIRAYLDLEGEAYWKDIREACDGACEKVWTITVESGLAGETVTLAWDAASVPEGASLVLTDESTGGTVDMGQASSYHFENTGTRTFTVRVSWHG
jgi:type 1 fimbria pilin